jgi:hypothetical protein
MTRTTARLRAIVAQALDAGQGGTGVSPVAVRQGQVGPNRGEAYSLHALPG